MAGAFEYAQCPSVAFVCCSNGNVNSVEGELDHFECHNDKMRDREESGDLMLQKESLSLQCFRRDQSVTSGVGGRS